MAEQLCVLALAVLLVVEGEQERVLVQLPSHSVVVHAPAALAQDLLRSLSHEVSSLLGPRRQLTVVVYYVRVDVPRHWGDLRELRLLSVLGLRPRLQRSTGLLRNLAVGHQACVAHCYGHCVLPLVGLGLRGCAVTASVYIRCTDCVPKSSRINLRLQLVGNLRSCLRVLDLQVD